MRLNDYERQVIIKHCRTVFPDAHLYLFGSRADDTKRGGDIDLFLEIEDKANLFKRKINFLSKIKHDLGEQKIDLIFNEDSERLIEKEARKWGILL